MRRHAKVLGLVLAAACAAQALAGEIPGQEIDRLLRGNTALFDVYDNPVTGGGIAPYFFGADGQAAIRLPNGTLMRGVWRIDGNAYCTDWDGGPQNSCSRLVQAADGTVEAVNPTDGKPRSRLTEILPGNPEGF